MSKLAKILKNHPGFVPVINASKPYKRLDFSESNKALQQRDLSDTEIFSQFVFEEMLESNSFIGIGGYNENRIIYRQRAHFSEDEAKPRSIHLGTDIWTDAGELVYAPLNATIHSFAFNDHYGDYGPTIILTHELAGTTFFTLYGHLSLDSLDGLYVGKKINAGEKLASIGPYPENGDWPPHLHFQIIGDMGNHQGDFPGVSSIENQEHYLSTCPDPNLLLRILEN
jgi:murein DD-endopeptidase MepM/ murein hydrolase activator NlpD